MNESRRTRWTEWTLAGTALLAPALVWFTFFRLLGFPDGHITDLERAQRPLYEMFCLTSLTFGVLSIRRAIRPPCWSRTRLWTLLYLALIVGVQATDVTLRRLLDTGHGG